MTRSTGLFKQNRTLKRDLIISLVLTTVTLLTLANTANYVLSVNRAEADLQRSADTLTAQLRNVLGYALWNVDFAAVQSICTTYLEAGDVGGIRVFDESGNVVFERLPENPATQVFRTGEVYYQERQVGRIEIWVSRRSVNAVRTNILSVAVMSTVVVAFTIVIATNLLLQRFLTQPVEKLIRGINIIAEGNYGHRLPSLEQAELDVISRQINMMAAQIESRDQYLEQQVADRTADLERRSIYLESAAEVGRATTSILDVDELIHQVVGLIRRRFDLYYVGLFLLDQRREWAVLQSGTGEAGEKMLARGHRLEVGGESMIGWSIAHAQARIAQVAEEDAVRLATPELPETRAEAALPLRSRGEVLGALTVQSERPGAFNEAIIAILQTMADQVAVAIDNARLFAESQAALEAEQRAYGELSREAWQELLSARSAWGYRYARQAISAAEGDWDAAMREAARTGQTIRATTPAGDNGAEIPMLAIPIQQRGKVVGVLKFRKDHPDETWTAEEITVLEDLIEQLGVALESARLYEDTQRRAAFERVTGEIASRFRESLDVDRILQTAASEFQEVLNLDTVEVRVGPAPSSDEMQ